MRNLLVHRITSFLLVFFISSGVNSFTLPICKSSLKYGPFVHPPRVTAIWSTNANRDTKPENILLSRRLKSINVGNRAIESTQKAQPSGSNTLTNSIARNLGSDSKSLDKNKPKNSKSGSYGTSKEGRSSKMSKSDKDVKLDSKRRDRKPSSSDKGYRGGRKTSSYGSKVDKVQVWRVYDVDVLLSDDPGKDSVDLHDNLLISLGLNLGIIDKRNRNETNDNNLVVHRNLESAIDDPLTYLRSRVKVVRKSLDARWKKFGQPKFIYTVDVTLDPSVSSKLHLRLVEGRLEIAPEQVLPKAQSNPNLSKKKVIVVGAGPAGLFAAIELCKVGFEPIIIDRGQPVEIRGRDIGALFNRKILNPNSNLCYGEGGAGTWSDGKLTTRIGKNSEDVRSTLETLVKYGAPERILVDGKPHLGTDRLVRILQNMRNDLIEQGAVFLFNSTVIDLLVDEASDTTQNRVSGVRLSDGKTLSSDYVVLAVGHTSRAMYECLMSRGVAIEPKGIAVGFRVEHPQDVINKIQYGEFGELCQRGKGPVPVADYRLAADVSDATQKKITTTTILYQNNGEETKPMLDDHLHEGRSEARSCYSFCMCPGGQIVPTSVDPNYLCINGMSFSKRQSPWANAAIVVSVSPDDMIPLGGSSPLRGMIWQQLHEKKAAEMGGGNLVAPVQRVTDFLRGQINSIGDSSPIKSSYRLGVREANCHEIYPPFVTEALRRALIEFDRRMPGFVCDDAILHGVETRTSSPVQIVRDKITFESVSVQGLYPSGEGAGYAGGIISAAVDGMKVARAITKHTNANDMMQKNEKLGARSI